jgi:hypothetical protein
MNNSTLLTVDTAINLALGILLMFFGRETYAFHLPPDE